ncbi:hypothetical protein LNV80_14145, partial [Klebsiella pneumoniae]|nr:hypothetical protein [Klebsiella pneumoniae]
VTLKMPAFEWVHVQLHQQKGMISLSPPTICNSANPATVWCFRGLHQWFTDSREAAIPCVQRSNSIPAYRNWLSVMT